MSVGQKHTYVGQFFEEVGQAILGGLLTRDERGDVFLPGSKTAVEVKGSTFQSPYGFRLSLDQVASYERIYRSGLTRNSLYMLFAYRNRSVVNKEHGRRVSELSQHVRSEDVRAYLSSSVMWGSLVDLSIVIKWTQMLPRQTKSIMGHLGMATVDVGCSQLENVLNGNLYGHLRDLGLDPVDYRKVTFSPTVSVEGIESGIQFPMTAVVLPHQVPVLRHALSRHGTRVRSVSI